MDSFDEELVAKAKRRIKRQILTGKRQHRVTEISEKIFQYRVNRTTFLRFRADSLNRLRLLS